MDDDAIAPMTELLDQFGDLLDELPDGAFDLATRCPDWTVTTVVSHCEAQLVNFLGINAEPAPGPANADRFDVYRHPTAEVAKRIHDRSIQQAAGRTPATLRADYHASAKAAMVGVKGIPADLVIIRPNGTYMPYGEQFASRHVEFAVHMMDVAAAAGHPEVVPAASGAIITEMLDDLLSGPRPEALGWDTAHYILVGLGRRELTPADREILGPLADRFPLTW
jgi:uncharacterized protein (TIGR03083 family)